MSSRVSKQHGFTMLELVAVVAVSAVLAVMGLPLIEDYQQDYAATGVQHRLAESLAQARERAVSQGKTVYICASADGATCSADAWTQGWLVYQGTERKLPGDRVPAEAVIEHITNTATDYSLAVLDESSTTVSDIRFDARGFNAAAQRMVAVMCLPGEAALDAVTVERTGRVHLGKHSAADQKADSRFHATNVSKPRDCHSV